MKVCSRMAGRIAAGILAAGVAARAPARELKFDEAFIPRFNIPHTSAAPVIDGTIGGDEWREAVKLAGVAVTHTLAYKDRPVFFWVAWDEQHLYLAARSDVLPGHRLYRQSRERYAQGVVYDDSYEFALFLHDRNQLQGEVSSFMKMVVNSLGSGEYQKIYPSIGQNLYNWRPDAEVANRVYEADGKKWWDFEMAMDLEDLQLPAPNRAGDELWIGLFADLKNPQWQWLDFPSASGHLEHDGFPRAVLTAGAPYVQVDRLAGLHDRRIDFRATVFNPSARPVRVDAGLKVLFGDGDGRTAPPRNASVLVDEHRALTIPAGGSAAIEVSHALEGLDYGEPVDAKGKPKRAARSGFVSFEVRAAGAAPGAAPVYDYHVAFTGTDKSYLDAKPRETPMEVASQYNPAMGLLELTADTLDAAVPGGTKPAGATYAVTRGAATVASGRLGYYAHLKYSDLVRLPDLAPGTYKVRLALVDAGGKELVARDDLSFTRKDEAKEFAHWWNNDIGSWRKVLKPFEPLEAGGNTIRCTRRLYTLDGLGLPEQIEADGGGVLAAPARIVVKVDGVEHTVPAAGPVRFTSKKDWWVDFEGPAAEVAGVRFRAKGWMEQDGLVELALTYEPVSGPVAIEALRIEWPVDDALGNRMSCIGRGGNYCARSVGAIPAGEGRVWDTLKEIGQTGSGMVVGSFTGNLWVGTEQRGLLWCADSDEGWEPHGAVAAHSIARRGGATVMVNHLVGEAEGKAPLALDAARTVRFGYNASPFRKLPRGWRYNQRSAANGFSGGKYKVDWDTGQDWFSVLSPPFADLKKWDAYYAHCKAEAARLTREGQHPGHSAAYAMGPRLRPYLTNQIALRGYMEKTREPGLYRYFGPDWAGEPLNKSYRDYMVYLMDRQVREGGCTHFYFDISFTGYDYDTLAAGCGYRLPDGRVQPTFGNTNLRRWYQRSYAMIQENNLWPGGISGHATHSISLKALPFADAILDSEYPMKDPIDAYTSDYMIALSCPHNFGVNISHLGFMNPVWPAMHDAGMGGGHGGVFGLPEMLRWGVTREDVAFVPYWRNEGVVKEAAPGLLVSVWKRPGSALVGILNYGLDPEGGEKERQGRVRLDLAALGVPADAIARGGERVRVRHLWSNDLEARYYGHLAAWEDRPEIGRAQDPKQVKRSQPPCTPRLDPKTGVVDGFPVFYHAARFVTLDWEEQPVADASWKDLPADRTALLDWGINTARELTPAEVAQAFDVPAGTQVRAWRRAHAPGVLVAVKNAAAGPTRGTLRLDRDALGLAIGQVWADFVSVVALDGMPARNYEREDTFARIGADGVSYNGWTGEAALDLSAGATRVFAVERY